MIPVYLHIGSAKQIKLKKKKKKMLHVVYDTGTFNGQIFVLLIKITLYKML